MPPSGDRGIEAFADLLCDALMTHGHEVTMFAAPGFRSPARAPSARASAPQHDRLGAARIAPRRPRIGADRPGNREGFLLDAFHCGGRPTNGCLCTNATGDLPGPC